MPEAVWTDGLESQERRFDEQLEAWLAYVKKVHADEDLSFLRSLVPTTEQLPRITAVMRELTPDIVARCTDRRWSDQELQGHIRNVAYFLQRFDEIIRPYQHSETVERPWFLRTDNPIFWRHLEFGKTLSGNDNRTAPHFKRSIGRTTPVHCPLSRKARTPVSVCRLAGARYRDRVQPCRVHKDPNGAQAWYRLSVLRGKPVEIIAFQDRMASIPFDAQLGGASGARVVDSAILTNLDIGRRWALLRRQPCLPTHMDYRQSQIGAIQKAVI
jgi:hypothetical protein